MGREVVLRIDEVIKNSGGRNYEDHRPTSLRSLIDTKRSFRERSLFISQLPGRLFSPSDKSKTLSHHFLLHFLIGMGSYDHHAKYQGVFMDLNSNTLFKRVPPLDEENLNEFKGGPL